jgi:serine/threonine-protein kinase
MVTRLARQIGRYHVMNRIAYGGMAEIFRGVTFDSQGSERLVAIKMVLPHFAEDHDFIRMLIDEEIGRAHV